MVFPCNHATKIAIEQKKNSRPIAAGRHLPSCSTQLTPHDCYDALLFRIADKIVPLFQYRNADLAAAKLAALSAIAAYHPESRADFVSIARILAFSMAALSALGIAAADDLPPALKMRYFGRAK